MGSKALFIPLALVITSVCNPLQTDVISDIGIVLESSIVSVLLSALIVAVRVSDSLENNDDFTVRHSIS